MTQYSSQIEQSGDGVANRILEHYRVNPFRLHVLAWMIATLPFFLLILPEVSVAAVMGFGISSIVFCTILCFATYPLSGHYSFTIVGVLVGAIVFPIGELVGVFSPIHGQFNVICALIGAIIGSTSMIWRLPLQILDAVRQP